MIPTPVPERVADDLPPALLVSPRRPDSVVLESALVECGIPARTALDETELAARIDEVGCLVITQEAFTNGVREAIGRVLDNQPAWSELPIVVILDHRTPDPGWNDFVLNRWQRANVTFLVRPLSGLELQSAVQLAITARMRQYLIRNQLEQERELRRELNHRVKNIFATVQAVASMTRRMATEDEDAFVQFEGRLAALGRVHGSLEQVERGAETFGSLARMVLAPFIVEGEDRFTITGPDRELSSFSGNVIGLCLFELATNASKHGALSVDQGHVRVELSEIAEQARLSWIETGGPPAQDPTRKGYGSRFLTTTLGSIFGNPPQMIYAAEGFRLIAEGRPDDLFR
ncbi:sensor histidine kinase [Salipiger sp. IMCC34102]|uniref:sensor histidine kinase n=1 Tax=Salipiger sp. IMCC34102 TaxID=2510647 RepID=UPI00101C3B37|nr:sensor histidine kinase [Salipiger sp. IMCC34102]RYH01355.1 sensor histidine kinase [Salipiger sp. IMCC34102]